MKRVIALMAMVALGLGFYLSPPAMQWNELRVDRNRDLNVEHIQDTRSNGEHNKMLADAIEYNRKLWDKEDRDSYPEEDAVKDLNYLSKLRDDDRFSEKLLNTGTLTAADAMGRVHIPKINVSMPIYHGATEDALSRGAGHVYGTSLPVGGPNTHTVITAHSRQGANGRFNGIRELEIGDEFYVTAAGQTMRYVVDEINVVLPEEVEYLQIIEGEDHATLLTCTPLGINSHRLLVRGVRAEKPAEASAPSVAPLPFPMFSAWWVGGITLAGVGGTLMNKRMARKLQVALPDGPASDGLAPDGPAPELAVTDAEPIAQPRGRHLRVEGQRNDA